MFLGLTASWEVLYINVDPPLPYTFEITLFFLLLIYPLSVQFRDSATEPILGKKKSFFPFLSSVKEALGEEMKNLPSGLSYLEIHYIKQLTSFLLVQAKV